MAKSSDLQVQEKKELVEKEEQTVPARYYVPYTDIYETEGALTVLMDMPGVAKGGLDITVEKNVLSVEGKIDFSNYEDLEPAYTEYNVGHFQRALRCRARLTRARSPPR
jgi:HSP20 family protein